MTWSLTLMAYLARRFPAVGADRVRRLLGAGALASTSPISSAARRSRAFRTDIVFSMSLLKLPDIAQKLLPFAVLLGRDARLLAHVAQP